MLVVLRGLCLGSLWGLATPAALAQAGTWSNRTPMPTARYGPAAGVINGALYVASGAVVINAPPFPRFTNLEVYDPAADAWVTKAPIPVGVYGATAGVIGTKLYVAGGQASQVNGNDIGNLQVYDPATDTWTTKTAMPFPASGTAGGVINGRLYVAGGYALGSGYANLRAYDPVTDTWTNFAAMPSVRVSGGAGVVNGILYVVGGNNLSTSLPTVEAYDPVANTWTAKAAIPTPRSQLSVAVFNGLLYALGGTIDGASGDAGGNLVEVYNPLTDSWSNAPAMLTATRLPGVGVVNGAIYVVGGVNSSGQMATNQAFLPAPLPPAITNQPVGVTASSGGSAVLSVGVSGAIPMTYQWLFAGTNLPGATNAMLSLAHLTPANVGLYTVAITNAAGGVISSPLSLTLVDVRMLAGLVVNGPVGSNYLIQAKANPLANWITLTNVALPTEPYIFVDYGSLTNPQQFYRATPQ